MKRVMLEMWLRVGKNMIQLSTDFFNSSQIVKAKAKFIK